jgi:hypothetical protein
MKNRVDTNPRVGERGAVSIKVLLALFAAAIVAFVVIKIAPVYVEQRDVIYHADELANKATIRSWKEDKIMEEAQRFRNDYSLPEDSVIVRTKGNKVEITVGYTRSIDLLVTTYDWKVEHTATGKEL